MFSDLILFLEQVRDGQVIEAFERIGPAAGVLYVIANIVVYYAIYRAGLYVWRRIHKQAD